jgi:hypothetical protein
MVRRERFRDAYWRCPVLNITEAATRCAMPAVGFVPMAHGLVPTSFAGMASVSPAYQALIVATRNDPQGGASAWSPPV